MSNKNNEKKWRNEETLRKLRLEKGMDFQEIADELGCSDSTVIDWCKKYDIPTSRYPQLRDEEWLKNKYINERKSTYEIADEVGCTGKCVHNWLLNHGIETRMSTVEKPPYFRTREDGYEEVKSKVNGQTQSVLIHRLLAVAKYGYEEVTGNWVHHHNRIPWDNRPENIETMSASEHGKHHSPQRDRDSEGLYA